MKLQRVRSSLYMIIIGLAAVLIPQAGRAATPGFILDRDEANHRWLMMETACDINTVGFYSVAWAAAPSPSTNFTFNVQSGYNPAHKTPSSFGWPMPYAEVIPGGRISSICGSATPQEISYYGPVIRGTVVTAPSDEVEYFTCGYANPFNYCLRVRFRIDEVLLPPSGYPPHEASAGGTYPVQMQAGETRDISVLRALIIKDHKILNPTTSELPAGNDLNFDAPMTIASGYTDFPVSAYSPLFQPGTKLQIATGSNGRYLIEQPILSPIITILGSTPTGDTGTIKLRGTVDGKEWTGQVVIDAKTPDGKTYTDTTADLSSTSDYLNLDLGSYTVKYKSGGPAKALLKRISPCLETACTQTLTKDSPLSTLTFEFVTVATGTVDVNATLDGKDWSGKLTFDYTYPAGSGTAVDYQVPNHYPDVPVGAYTLTYKSGGPAGATLKRIRPCSTAGACTQQLATGATLPFTFEFTASPPGIGAVEVNATLDGNPWTAGEIAFTYQNPSGSSTTKTEHMPVRYDSQATGNYMVSYVSGGPVGTTLKRVGPCAAPSTQCSQKLDSGKLITLTLDFATPTEAGATSFSGTVLSKIDDTTFSLRVSGVYKIGKGILVIRQGKIIQVQAIPGQTKITKQGVTGTDPSVIVSGNVFTSAQGMYDSATGKVVLTDIQIVGTLPPQTGTVIVNAQLDGNPLASSVDGVTFQVKWCITGVINCPDGTIENNQRVGVTLIGQTAGATQYSLYYLGIGSDPQGKLNGAQFIGIAPSESQTLATGQTITFALRFTSSASYNTAACVGINAPDQIPIGQTFNALVTMKNTGINPWSPLGQDYSSYRLGSQEPQDTLRWGRHRASLTGTVDPGATVDIGFSAIAPIRPGTYPFAWQMVQEGIMWFGQICRKDIVVTSKPLGTKNALGVATTINQEAKTFELGTSRGPMTIRTSPTTTYTLNAQPATFDRLVVGAKVLAQGISYEAGTIDASTVNILLLEVKPVTLSIAGSAINVDQEKQILDVLAVTVYRQQWGIIGKGQAIRVLTGGATITRAGVSIPLGDIKPADAVRVQGMFNFQTRIFTATSIKAVTVSPILTAVTTTPPPLQAGKPGALTFAGFYFQPGAVAIIPPGTTIPVPLRYVSSTQLVLDSYTFATPTKYYLRVKNTNGRISNRRPVIVTP